MGNSARTVQSDVGGADLDFKEGWKVIKTKTITVERTVPDKIICDMCGRVIQKTDVKTYDFGSIGDHYKVTCGHCDWGNDSVDSVQNYDICSKKCMTNLFLKYLGVADGSKNTAYIEINHDWFYKQAEEG